MANAVNLKCTNTIDDNDVSNGKIDNFDESSVVQQENSLNYHPSPLVTNNCSGEVVQFNGNIDEVSENHRDIIPNDDNKLIITLNSNGGKKKKKIRKSFGFFFGNSFSIGGRISSDVNFQMALEELYLKNHIESNVNQTITNSIAFKNYSNNFTVENYGNKKSQQFNLFEWSNNDPSKQSNVNQKTSITNSVASQIYSNNFMGEYYRDKKRQQFNLFECLNNGFSHQIKYPLLSTNGCVEFRGSNIDHNKFLENRSIVSIGSNFGKK
uniref:Uncharacterized protein n=1 Tax=Meloidogyne hapla TaxID=6305 RepID=A0A1I8B0A6_MELHA